jgi:hypothetical protein
VAGITVEDSDNHAYIRLISVDNKKGSHHCASGNRSQ